MKGVLKMEIVKKEKLLIGTFITSLAILTASAAFYANKAWNKKADRDNQPRTKQTNNIPVSDQIVQTSSITSTNQADLLTTPVNPVKVVQQDAIKCPDVTDAEVMKWYFKNTPKSFIKGTLVTSNCRTCYANAPQQKYYGYYMPSSSKSGKKDFFIESQTMPSASNRLAQALKEKEAWTESIRQKAQAERQRLFTVHLNQNTNQR